MTSQEVACTLVSRVPALYPSGRSPKWFPQYGLNIALMSKCTQIQGYNPKGPRLKPLRVNKIPHISLARLKAPSNKYSVYVIHEKS